LINVVNARTNATAVVSVQYQIVRSTLYPLRYSFLVT